MTELLINIDVPSLIEAVAFYTDAFGLTITRRLGDEVAELSGWPSRLYLLQKPGGSIGAGNQARRYERHWTPVHFDIVVDDVVAAVARAVAAGARLEREIRAESGRDGCAVRPFRTWFLPDSFPRTWL